MYVYAKGAIDLENHFHNCLRESEKALLVPVSTKGSMVDHECGNWIIIWTMQCLQWLRFNWLANVDKWGETAEFTSKGTMKIAVHDINNVHRGKYTVIKQLLDGKANQKVLQLVGYVYTWIYYVSVRIKQNINIVASIAFPFTWLLWHQTNRFWKNCTTQFIKCCWPRIVCGKPYM